MKNVLAFVCCVLLAAGTPSAAQEMMKKKDKMPMEMHSKDMMGMQDEFVKDAIAQFSSLGEKYAALAKAVPADKLDWRPGEGVRSVREVLIHAADANIMFLGMAGIKGPEGRMTPKDKMERENRFKTNDEIAKAITESFDFAKEQVAKLSHDQLHAEATMFGQKTTNLNVLIVSIGHLHEHLGQSIAYARTNGVVPPWSAM